MSQRSRPRYGSLQFWPRKRAKKFLPSVNWKPVLEKQGADSEGILGFIGYKVGMASAIVKDNTEKSMTKGKRKAVPVTILEVPGMGIYSVRFYKQGVVSKEVVVAVEKGLKKNVKVSKNPGKLDSIKAEDYDDVRVIVYSHVGKTGIKKKSDFIELGVNAKDKLAFVKGFIGKEIGLEDTLKHDLVDVRGLTKGQGFSGTVKRFGIKLRPAKSEKGVRKPGSIGPWHPAHVVFRVPMAGQLGMFSRVHYNLKVVESGNIKERDINKKSGYKNYGNIKTSYVMLAGSVQGPAKRQILVTPSIRASKLTAKKSYEFLELI
jgi:large subunit ribosomal protein L3